MKEVNRLPMLSPFGILLIISLVLQIGPQFVSARTTQKTLLDVTDRLQVYSRDR